LKWEKENQKKRGNDEKVVTIKENKETKDEKKKTKATTKLKLKNDKKKNL
jgi:hypothetical protein